jgi:predicted Holliday junction resolvase-like endonuclease
MRIEGILKIINYFINNKKKVFFFLLILILIIFINFRLVRKVTSLRCRVQKLEERVEEQQEMIVEGVQRNWMRDIEYERLIRERNKLRIQLSNLEEVVARGNNNNDNNDNNEEGNSRERIVGFGFFGGGRN